MYHSCPSRACAAGVYVIGWVMVSVYMAQEKISISPKLLTSGAPLW